jgi:hypothetical protein
LRLEIARGRSCTSVLVVPQRKSSLVEAMHAGWPRPSSSSMVGHGSSPGQEGKGRRRRGGGCCTRGFGLDSCTCLLLCCLREEEDEREEKRGKGRGRKKRRKRNGKIFPNMKNFEEKNKRQFMKLVQKIFFLKIGLIIIK